MTGMGLSDFPLKHVIRSHVRDAVPIPKGEGFEQTGLAKFPLFTPLRLYCFLSCNTFPSLSALHQM